ncbi:MATE family efflux transporter [Aurantivibrio plasticivorans]
MSISYSYILQRAWPIILANASVPLLALADTAIIGNLGTTSDLGAIAFGSLIFNFIYWSFGFLRMGTTGFISQANGARNEPEVRNVLWRSLLIAGVIGASIILLQWPIKWLTLSALHGDMTVETLAADYFSIRVWGAPATLATFALMGTLIGLGASRLLLALQIFLNGLNIVLDYFFAGFLNMGASGIALGTFIAEWSAFIVGLFIVISLLRRRNKDSSSEKFIHWQKILDPQLIHATLSANGDIFIRTVLLLLAFYWFTDQSAQFSNDILAANHILLQIISFSAFFIDGFAFVAESLVGTAIGGKNKIHFQQAVKRSSILAGITALGLAVIIVLLGQHVVDALTNITTVREAAYSSLWFVAIYVLFSVGAFQLDGIFIGATRTREMRLASLQATAIFFLTSLVLTPWLHNAGLWLSFIVYVLCRALMLLRFFETVSPR